MSNSKKNTDETQAALESLAIESLAIRSGYEVTQQQEHSEAIFATSSFVYESAAQAAARFSGDEAGNIYSRFTNPTVQTFEKRLAAMEGGEACIATASGMSAIFATFMGLLQAGDHVVCSRSVFGTTLVMLDKLIQKFDISVDYVDLSDLDQWRAAIKPNTRLLFAETPSNPVMELVDIAALAEIAQQAGVKLAIDNCFCTPVLQQPLALGADIVIHSATKFIDGQGRCLGGAVVSDQHTIDEHLQPMLRTAGLSMSPFNAWVFLKGLETLSVRMQHHCNQAMALAQWLLEQEGVEHVYYPGLTTHPQHQLATQQQSGYGGIVSFSVKGGQKAAWALMDATRLFSITANLGDVKSTLTHPASTTHGRLTPEDRTNTGITDGMIRVSVGFEALGDLTLDLQAGLKALQS